jgi:hypothetical protein
MATPAADFATIHAGNVVFRGLGCHRRQLENAFFSIFLRFCATFVPLFGVFLCHFFLVFAVFSPLIPTFFAS